jgi:hypothetical protein
MYCAVHAYPDECTCCFEVGSGWWREHVLMPEELGFPKYLKQAKVRCIPVYV